jgi:hypothetical protein
LFVAVWATPALAYIDPGTGSAAYQIILTGFLAVGYALRRFWWRASGKLPKNAEDSTSSTSDLTSSSQSTDLQEKSAAPTPGNK